MSLLASTSLRRPVRALLGMCSQTQALRLRDRLGAQAPDHVDLMVKWELAPKRGALPRSFLAASKECSNLSALDLQHCRSQLRSDPRYMHYKQKETLELRWFNLDSLLVAQPFIYDDIPPLGEKVSHAEHLRLCISSTELAEPQFIESHILEFFDDRGRAAHSLAPRYRRVDDGRIDLNLQILSAPNCMRVIDTSAGYLLSNGHHRAAELFKIGVRRIVAILDTTEDVDGFCHARGFLDFVAITKYKPTIADYFDDQISSALTVRRNGRSLVIRIAIEQRITPHGAFEEECGTTEAPHRQ
jgi:hypothetical protein